MAPITDPGTRAPDLPLAVNEGELAPSRPGAGLWYAAALAGLFLVVALAHVTGLRNSLASALAAWALWCLFRERLVPPLALPMSAWLVVGAASALWSAVAEDALKAAFYDIVLPAGAFYGAYIVSRRAAGYRLLTAAVIAGVVMLASFSVLASWLASRQAIGRVPEGAGGLLYYHPGEGTTSTLGVYGLAFALLLAGSPGYRARILGYVGLACIIVAGVETDNRMFWPSAVAVLGAFWLWQWRAFGAVQRIAIAAVLAFCAAGAVGMVLRLTGAGEVVGVVARDNRPAAWQEWSKIAAQAPVLGYGLGLKAIKETGSAKLPPEFAQRHPEMRFHAHNLLLDVVLQVGIVGLLVYTLLLAALAREAWATNPNPHRRAVSAALIALLVGMLAKNAADDFMHHGVVIAFWGYAGILVGRLRGGRPD